MWRVELRYFRTEGREGREKEGRGGEKNTGLERKRK